MKKTTTTAKQTTTPKNVNAPKQDILKINLDKFADALKDKNVDKTQKDRQHLYIYPDTFTPADLNGQKGKKHRQTLRNKLGRFSNNIFFHTKTQNVENLQKEIAEFEIFYKEHFRLNDFTVKSLSASDKQTADLQIMLDIIKDVKGA